MSEVWAKARESLHYPRCLSGVQTTEDSEGLADEGEREGSYGKDVIYKVPCLDCDMKSIRETKRTMKKRLTEHW